MNECAALQAAARSEEEETGGEWEEVRRRSTSVQFRRSGVSFSIPPYLRVLDAWAAV
jgi:hypothetical protein